jgi:hypothetical protein
MITIITPTYNRAYTLERLYFSLKDQDSHKFEWVVVDDGSTDRTKLLLSDFVSSSPFQTQVVSQSNSGKHAAINAGVSMSSGEWVFIVDSDDALTHDAISTIYKNIQNVSADVVGLCFRRRFFQGEIVGDVVDLPNPSSLKPSEVGRLFKGDLAYVFRRNALLKFPFPLIPGERFVPELYIWNMIGDDGDILYFGDKAIYECEYLEDGYSANFESNLRRNPQGFLLFYVTQASREPTCLGRLKCLIRCIQCVFFIVSKGNTR